MLPLSYGIPAAIALIVGGTLSCFAGYRLFRVVLAIYGFILGAMLASSMMGANSTGAMVMAAIVGGLAGALVLTLAYFFGTGDPPAIAVILLAIAGSIGAMLLQRYVIIVATAFGGAWTLVVGLFAMT